MRVHRSILLALTVACGGASSGQPTAVALPSASSTAPDPLPTRGPSEALLAAWPLAEAPSVAYADLHGLVQTKLFQGLVPALIATPSLLTPDQATCATSLAAGARELLVGAQRTHEAFVIRFDKDTPSLRRCITDTIGIKEAMFSDDGIVVVVHHTQPTHGTPPTARDLRLRKDQYLTGRFKETDDTTADFTLTVSDAHFAVNIAADLPGERDAELIEHGLSLSPDQAGNLGMGTSPDQVAALVRLMKSLHTTRKGSHLDIAFDLAEPPVDQARDLGAAASLAISGVHKYLVESKKAEALNNINQIAQDIVMDWEREPLVATAHAPRRAKKLRSFPAVPRTVPRGVTYASSPDDWKPWDPIKFSIDAPQHYQYEVRAAPDGQTADVIAHGDLNGDGKTSTFTLSVRVDKQTKGLVISPVPIITDGDE